MRTDWTALSEALDPHRIVPVKCLASRPLTECFLGVREPSGTRIFIKVMDSPDPKIQRNFSREVAILQALGGQPGFPALFASSPGGVLRFHACEYISEPALQALAQRPGGEGLLPILRIAEALAGWLREFHARGYVHRDLAPDHIFAIGAEAVVVVDFGMAKPTGELSASGRKLCEGYDIQSFGMVLWEAICGRPLFPYRRPELPKCLTAQLGLLRDLPLPPPLVRLIAGCLCTRSEFTPEGLWPFDGWNSAEDLCRAMSEIWR
jgi:serine/threonine protein kinase